MNRDRLHSLDAARGLAALSVVVWHWQHMYWMEGFAEVDRASQPFYAVLRPLYEAGFIGVDFFFVLSGFIFYWLYSAAVAGGQVSALRFSLARFSRLYPLHLVTLLLVVALQAVRPADFVYPADSWADFAKQLLLVQSWTGIQDGSTFNGPAWSISVEVFLYVVFWLICRMRWGSSLYACLALGAFGAALAFFSPTIGQAIGGFFLGGAMYHVWSALADQPRAAKFVIAATAAAWAAEIAKLALTQFEFSLAERLVLFPASVLALALAERLWDAQYAKLAWLGDISYSSYLLHFPLQLAFANLVLLAGLGTDAVTGPAGFIAFFAVLIVISLASYRWFELPAQAFLRARMGTRSKKEIVRSHTKQVR